MTVKLRHVMIINVHLSAVRFCVALVALTRLSQYNNAIACELQVARQASNSIARIAL